MGSNILVAAITSSGAILVAAITFYLTKRHQLEVEWQHEKLNHYKVLLSALSGLAHDPKNKQELKRFALAANTITLCASQAVITALMNLQEASSADKGRDILKQNRLLKELLLAIRKDIGLSLKDDADTFKYHLLTSSAPEG
jgi:hypothetical protein